MHAGYRIDLLGETEAPQTRSEDSELQVMASQLIGRSARVPLVSPKMMKRELRCALSLLSLLLGYCEGGLDLQSERAIRT